MRSLLLYIGCCQPKLWQYGLWSFQTGGRKLERFLPKNHHTQRILLNFENLVNLVKRQKLSESFSIFFFH